MNFFIRWAHFIFFILFIFSLVFFLERVAYIDSSFHLFKLINAESLTFEANRYGAFLTKWPVLLLIKIGASLKLVMLVFSSWFIIWYYLIFLFITYILKNKFVGIALAASLVTGYGNTFFHCVTETHQALVYCLLFYAWISNTRVSSSVAQIIIGILLIILSFLTHPISFLVIITLLGFHLSKENNYKKLSNYSFLISIMAIVGLKLLLTESGSYEGDFFDFKDIMQSFKPRMYNWVFYYRNIFFLYFIPTLSIILVGFYALKQKSLTYIYAFLSSITLLFLLILFYKGGATVMKERAILPFCTVVVLFITELFLKNNIDRLSTRIFALTVPLIGFTVIFSFHFSHTERIARYQSVFLSEKFNEVKKIIVPTKEIDSKNKIITWPIPYETLLISSVDGNANSKSLFPLLSDNQLDNVDMEAKNLFLGAPFYLKHNASEFNKNYFTIDDCTYLQLESLPK